MELYFCTRCGISIPQVEVESGSAGGDGRNYYCAEHREPAAEAPGAGGSQDSVPIDDLDVELLFCSNCRVSIPMTDARSGRARKQYGSMLCAVCAKADPGERAARREAVEADLAADVQQNDPLAAVRPPSSNDRPPMDTSVAPSSSSFAVQVVLVFGVCLVAGIVGASMLLKEDTKPPKDYAPEIAQLRGQVQGLENELAERDSAISTLRDDLGRALEKSGQEVEGRVGERLTTLEGGVEGFSRQTLDTERKLAERVSRAEGALTQLAEQVRALGVERPAPPPEEVTNGGGMVTPPVQPDTNEPPTVKPPDPRVLELCKELLDPKQEDSVRFPAATELGRLGDPAAIPSLVKALLADDHFLVRRACARSLGNLKAWYATPYLIQALQDKEAYVAQQASYALQTITKQDFGVTQDQALGERKRRARQAGKWWDQNSENPPDGVSLQPSES